MKERIAWIDIAKCIGIFAIYLGHFGELGGLAYAFVFSFHVPLFFFLSGCTSNYDHEPNLFKFVMKKFKRIIVPFYFFALASVMLSVITHNYGCADIKEYLIIIVKGCIRNQFFASSLWFLTCLFVMEIIFKVMKMMKNRYLIILVSLLMFLLSEFIISPRPIMEPHWIYNVDSAMYYIVFYALGYWLYPFFIKLFELNTRKKITVFSVLLIITGIYAAVLFERVSLLIQILMDEHLGYVLEIVQPMILITFVLCVSKLLEGTSFLSSVGKDTLFLCGNEFLIKESFPMLLSAIGLSPILDNPLKTYIYTVILIAFCVKVLIPTEKALVATIKSKFVNTQPSIPN